MNVYPTFQIDPKLLEIAGRAEELAQAQFQEIEATQRYNQQKIQTRMRQQLYGSVCMLL